MKITKADIGKNVGNGSSYKLYICKNREDADIIHGVAMSMKPGDDLKEWYYSVTTCEAQCCLVPEFFHNRGYYVTIIEHNNGDWCKDEKYELYIVE